MNARAKAWRSQDGSESIPKTAQVAKGQAAGCSYHRALENALPTRKEIISTKCLEAFAPIMERYAQPQR